MSDVKQEFEIRRSVAEINRYRFVGESGLSVAVIIGAVQRAAKNLIDLQIPLSRMEETQLSKFVALGTKDELVALEALSEIHSHPLSRQISKSFRTSMIGKSQRETEIPLDPAEWVLRASRYFDVRTVFDLLAGPAQRQRGHVK